MVKAVIFDFNRTLYDPDSGALVDGAMQVLGVLSKSFRLVLLSKAGDGNRKGLFDELGITSFFEFVRVVEEKSELEFREMVGRLGLNSSEVLAIGDQVKKDVKLAKAVGCKTVWFKQGKFAGVEPDSFEETPDYVVSSLLELPKLVSSLA